MIRWLTQLMQRRSRFEMGLGLPMGQVKQIVQETGAQPWHAYVIGERAKRAEVRAACEWVARHVPKSASIFEPGCGCGPNLIWLGQRGYRRLAGSDIAPEAIAAGRRLLDLARIRADLVVDDACAPASKPASVDVVLCINWLYLVEGATLEAFLRVYLPCLSPRGAFVFDVIDSAYNAVPLNQYRTSDWTKPEAERKPSEYRFRMGRGDVEAVARTLGLSVTAEVPGGDLPPRKVYALTRSA